jgi:hypothetical protein
MWHALADDEVAGKAHVVRRPDRRYFVAIDAWRDDVFDALLDAVVHDLPHELSAIVGEADNAELARWSQRGFTQGRREDEYEIRLEDSARLVVPVPAGYSLIVNLVLAEADAADVQARALLARFTARRTGGTLELVRDAPS